MTTIKELSYYFNEINSPNCVFCGGSYPSEDAAFRFKVSLKEESLKEIICCSVCIAEKILDPEIMPKIIKIENLGKFI